MRTYSLYQSPEEYQRELSGACVARAIRPLRLLLEQLREEEDYYPGEQQDTKRMITRLRKVFYDQWGWNSAVIPGAAAVPGRYAVRMIRDEAAYRIRKKRDRSRANGCRADIGLVPRVVYRKEDLRYPERAGTVPEIYANDNQEILLPDGSVCDLGHVLTGLDALNHPAAVTPLPRGLPGWVVRTFPVVDSNADFATWLGDLASTAGGYLIRHLRRGALPRPAGADAAEAEAEAEFGSSDMLGNIDAFVISRAYDTGAERGERPTRILEDYYFDDAGVGASLRRRRCQVFCDAVGLRGWRDGAFANEGAWLGRQIGQLRAAAAFYLYGDLPRRRGCLLAAKLCLRLHDRELRLQDLLERFLAVLKGEIIRESVRAGRGE